MLTKLVNMYDCTAKKLQIDEIRCCKRHRRNISDS